MIPLLLMLVIGGPGTPTPQPPGPPIEVCSEVTIKLFRGMSEKDFDDVRGVFDKWVVKAKKDCRDPEA